MDHCAVEVTHQTSSTQSELTLCLAGMPNSGKTTLMNALTGGSFRTGNYPGVTVSVLEGRTRPALGAPLTIIDLPGINSTYSSSHEEELSIDVITGRHRSVRADLFIVVVDATQLERHLKFAGFVARNGRRVIIALTMTDLLPRLHQSVEVNKLAVALGVPVVPVDARSGKGVARLLEVAREVATSDVADSSLSRLPADPVEAFGIVGELLRESQVVLQTDEQGDDGDPLTDRIDRVVLHRLLGFPIFFVILAGLFAAIFWVASPLMDAVDVAFGMAGDLVVRLLGEGMIARFIGEGVIRGVGVVAIFFPQVVILFFLMTLLEDSGYLARGAALVDRPLRRLGLHGKSFVPMLSGFACAIPATLAARAIPSKRERLLTIWILPLMSCSARLPVYALLLAALLPRDAPWRAGLALAGIYISSLLIGSLIAGLIGRFLERKHTPSLLAMELPIYRQPQVKPILRMTWARSSGYLKEAGLPIAVVAACLWLLTNFGLGSRQPSGPGEPARSFISATTLDHSFAAELGGVIEPALRPMGTDWRVGVGLIAAFAAREVFVSSLAIVFHVAGEDETLQAGLLEEMRTATIRGTNQPVFTTASILGLIVFFFFSLQCFSTLAVVRRETHSLRFVGLQLLFYTGLGYLAAVGVVQGLRLAGVA